VIADYHCTRCDVRGFGDRCWLCGSTTALRPTVVRDTIAFDDAAPARRGRRTAPDEPAPRTNDAPRPAHTRKTRVHDALASELR
jgi:hypothetical protein